MTRQTLASMPQTLSSPVLPLFLLLLQLATVFGVVHRLALAEVRPGGRVACGGVGVGVGSVGGVCVIDAVCACGLCHPCGLCDDYDDHHHHHHRHQYHRQQQQQQHKRCRVRFRRRRAARHIGNESCCHCTSFRIASFEKEEEEDCDCDCDCDCKQKEEHGADSSPVGDVEIGDRPPSPSPPFPIRGRGRRRLPSSVSRDTRRRWFNGGGFVNDGTDDGDVMVFGPRRHARKANRRRRLGVVLAAKSDGYVGDEEDNGGESNRGRGTAATTNRSSSSSSSLSTKKSPAASSKDQDETDGWSPNTSVVDDDLNALRMAIAESRADVDLKSSERLHLSGYLARARRPLVADVLACVLLPIVASVWISSAMMHATTALSSSSSLALGRKMSLSATMATAFVAIMNAHYWSFCVVSPLIMLAAKRRAANKDRMVPSKSRWDADYVPPEASCDDHVLCLLENWSSCISGTSAVLACAVIYRLCKSAGKMPSFHVEEVTAAAMATTRAMAVALASSRLLNRIGAAAALNQYPELLYRLRRENQPRPFTAFVAFLKPIVAVLLSSLPFGLASDLASLRLAAATAHPPPSFLGSFLSTLRNHEAIALILCTFTSPIIHLVAIAKIFRIKVCAGIALLPTNDNDPNLVMEGEKKKHPLGFRHRYWFRWRTPRRVSRMMRKWWRDDFILAGRGPLSDKGWMDRPSTLFALDESSAGMPDAETLPTLGRSGLFEKRRKSMEQDRDGMMEDLPILQRIAEDEEKGFFEGRPGRSDWPKLASKRLASRHQRNFDRKNFEDPLGIAVQQTFGIGLNYDFDYDVPVIKGTKPSMHVLRARAARSAIRYIRDLENNMNDQIDLVDNAEERIKLGLELSRKLGSERRRLAKELVTLIPTHAGVPDGRKLESIQAISESDAKSLLRDRPKVTDPDSFVTTYGVNPLSDGVEDPFLDETYVNDLLRLSKRRIATEMAESSNSLKNNQDENISDNDDYVSEWMKQRYAGRIKDYSDEDDGVVEGTNNTETFLA